MNDYLIIMLRHTHLQDADRRAHRQRLLHEAKLARREQNGRRSRWFFLRRPRLTENQTAGASAPAVSQDEALPCNGAAAPIVI